MIIVKQSYRIITPLNGRQILRDLEVCGRTCYKSEDAITDDSAREFVGKILARGHESVIEHKGFSVKFITDRGVTHEIVRHRLSSYSQESTRYCNYNKDKFSNQITVILPVWFYEIDVPYELAISSGYKDHTDLGRQFIIWHRACQACEYAYNKLIEMGQQPQQARAVLPNSLKTEIVVTANLREWRHILRLRTASNAHPQMSNLMFPLLTELKKELPVLFDDIKEDR